MDYKYGKQNKADVLSEKPADRYEEEAPKKTDVAALTEVLKGKGVSFGEFASTSEEKRKGILGKDYQATKDKCCWLYDQPIVTEDEDEDDKSDK